MVPLAPRYDPRIVDAVRALDDRGVSMAETCRRVGTAAERMGLFRPSYAHLRRFIKLERELQDAERERHEAMRELVQDVTTKLVIGRFVHAYEVADRVHEIRSRGP
jgi:hypothetical protein